MASRHISFDCGWLSKLEGIAFLHSIHYTTRGKLHCLAGDVAHLGRVLVQLAGSPGSILSITLTGSGSACLQSQEVHACSPRRCVSAIPGGACRQLQEVHARNPRRCMPACNHSTHMLLIPALMRCRIRSLRSPLAKWEPISKKKKKEKPYTTVSISLTC